MSVVQMNDADHLPMTDHHLQEARAKDHQREEVALQEQEAADHLQETATAEVITGEIAHHPEDEAVHPADVDAEKAVILRTGDIALFTPAKK